MASGAVSLGRGINIIRAGGGSSGGALDTDARTYCDNALIFGQTPIAYDNAASFNGTNQYLSVASNSSLQNGGGSYSLAFWVRFSSLAAPNAVQVLMAKGQDASCEYEFFAENGSTLVFSVGNGTSGTSFCQTRFPGITANTWYFVVGVYDSSIQKTRISVNGSAFSDSPTTISQPPPISSPFEIGRRNPNGFFWTFGQISNLGFWKRALTATEISRLYNGGLGLPYASFDSALKTLLVSYWRLNDTADSQGTNTLTNNGSVTFNTIGPVATLYDNARSLINSFVLGIKGLGLWSNMVCWPLRASQNAFLLGNGLTAKSLGGLGSYDGTLTNMAASSAWGSQGTNFVSASSHYINCGATANKPVGNADRTLFVVPFGTLNADQDFISYGSAATNTLSALNQNFGVGYRSTTGADVTQNPTVSNIGVWGMPVGTYVGSTTTNSLYVNGVINNSATGTTENTNATNLWIGGRTNSSTFFNGQIAIAGLLNSALSASQVGQLYSIYKDTLGKGLGLP